MKVAFTATLHPMDPAPEATPAALPQEPQQSAGGTNRQQPLTEVSEVPVSAIPPTADNASGPAEGNSQLSPVSHEGQPDGKQERVRKPQEDGSPEAAAGSADRLVARPLGTLDVRPPDGGAKDQRPAAAEPPPETARPQAEPAAEPVKTAAAHDIKLQVSGEGDRKVELRVTERGGDVHVAVRTSDTRLAGELREDLPALASRLEQSGFRAETWRPTAGTERQHLAEPQAGAASQDAHDPSRQNDREQHRDAQEQKQRDPENTDHSAQRKPRGKDFEWLLSSLR